MADDDADEVCPSCGRRFGEQPTWDCNEDVTDSAVNAAYEAINECRRTVMGLYGGNLDHPALDHLEAAMSAITEVERAGVTSRKGADDDAR